MIVRNNYDRVFDKVIKDSESKERQEDERLKRVKEFMQKPQRGTGFVSAMGTKTMKGEMTGMATGIGTIENSTVIKRANSKAALN